MDVLNYMIFFFRFDPQTGLLTGTNDGTLVNFYLRMFGRKTENSLCVHLLLVQVIYLFVKFYLSPFTCALWGRGFLPRQGFGLHYPMLPTILGPGSVAGPKQEFQAS